MNEACLFPEGIISLCICFKSLPPVYWCGHNGIRLKYELFNSFFKGSREVHIDTFISDEDNPGRKILILEINLESGFFKRLLSRMWKSMPPSGRVVIPE
jgi:hypothetical protein